METETGNLETFYHVLWSFLASSSSAQWHEKRIEWMLSDWIQLFWLKLSDVLTSFVQS